MNPKHLGLKRSSNCEDLRSASAGDAAPLDPVPRRVASDDVPRPKRPRTLTWPTSPTRAVVITPATSQVLPSLPSFGAGDCPATRALADLGPDDRREEDADLGLDYAPSPDVEGDGDGDASRRSWPREEDAAGEPDAATRHPPPRPRAQSYTDLLSPCRIEDDPKRPASSSHSDVRSLAVPDACSSEIVPSKAAPVSGLPPPPVRSKETIPTVRDITEALSKL